MRAAKRIRRQWTEGHIPDQRGRVTVVTGANSGVGFETARLLAEHGASVVLVCRDPAKAEAAIERIRPHAPNAQLSTVRMDLLSLASVREAADRIRAEQPRIDLLFNNAGTTFEQRTESADGFEATFATNHLGPFAFTGLLLDRFAAVPGARVVTVSSLTHRLAPFNIDDLQCEDRRYRNMTVYAQTKLANLLFTLEFQRRLDDARASAIAVAAHPGAARTDFTGHMGPLVRKLDSGALRPLVAWTQQSAVMGALASLRAAVDPDVVGGGYFGPPGFKGYPVPARVARYALDAGIQRRLWRESERLTGVVYEFGRLSRKSETDATV